MKLNFVCILFLGMVLFSCDGENKKTENAAKNTKSVSPVNTENQIDEWEQMLASVAKIESYDNGRILEKGQGFFVGANLLVTKYSLVNQATEVKIQPLDGNKTYSATRFVAFDRINDLIILEVDSVKREPIVLVEGEIPRSAKTMYIAPKTSKTTQLFTGKVLNLANVKGINLYRLTNRIRSSQFGSPIFVSNKKAIGVAFSAVVDYEEQSFATPSFYISEMLKNKKGEPELLETLKISANSKVAAENMKIKGLVIETGYGNITIKLFNETPGYRDNFIRLVKEDFYDSLLIHRVIADFGIQSGAADTRYARPGDNVGWKGPGYTIPAHVVDGLYHKRGMIGSPRKPDTANERRRSDGSQFYIVSGRKYFDNELDDLETQNNYTFSKEQRQVYKSVGGAPHLDGSYTIFGQVVSGMEVVDKIAKVETDKRWRPVKDIRVKDIRILK